MSGSLRLTPEQLLSFNGSDPSQPLLLAIRGRIYDVSSGRDFYGPGGAYNVFAGRECARALAIMKVALEECNAYLDDVDEKAIKTLNDWEAKLSAKYAIVGEVIAGW
jgi:membrane-associated progesterone receptor component